MKTLAVLPISTKNMLEESRVLQFIQRWAQSRPLSQPAEQDGYSSESTSRAQTPLNTPDGPPAKLVTELDGDTPKRAVYRRLKIISENSLDSGMSDASKASDGKEAEDEEEEEMEDEPSQLEATIEMEVKVENSEAPSESQAELEPELKHEPPETEEVTHSTPEATGSEGETLETQEPEEKPNVKPEEQLEDEKIVEEIKSDEPSESQTESATVEDAPSVTDTTSAADISNDVVAEVETPMTETQVENASSEQCSSEGNESCSTAEITPTQPSETIMESVSSESSTVVAIESTPTESPSASVETTPPESAAVSAENVSSEASVAAGSADTSALAIVAVPAEGAAVGTPSQDEEEGVSDVESERSQEPQVRASDISDMAARLLDIWKDLKARLKIVKSRNAPITFVAAKY